MRKQRLSQVRRGNHPSKMRRSIDITPDKQQQQMMKMPYESPPSKLRKSILISDEVNLKQQ
jgi:hypothetical protein